MGQGRMGQLTAERAREARREIPRVVPRGPSSASTASLQGHSVKSSEPVIGDSSYLADFSDGVVHIDLCRFERLL